MFRVLCDKFAYKIKFGVHKSKFLKKKPSFLELAAYIRHYVLSISECKNKKAVRSYNLCKLYKIFI